VVDAANVLKPRWIEEDLGTWVWGEAYLGAHQLEPCLTGEGAARTAGIVRRLEAAFGRPFLIENAPVYLAMGEHDMWTHLGLVAEAADSGIVIDVGHMIGAHINGDVPMRIPSPDWLGWTRIREVHFSGFEIRAVSRRSVWRDRHDLPFNELLLEWGATILEAIPCPVAVTLELDGANLDVVDTNLDMVRSLIRRREAA
jgi:uncharacterized protein (UPF0276 family)